MEKRKIAFSPNMKNGLDDDYTLYEDGSVLHEYDANNYPSGLNRRRNLTVDSLDDDIKKRLLNATQEEDKEIAKKLLSL